MILVLITLINLKHTEMLPNLINPIIALVVCLAIGLTLVIFAHNKDIRDNRTSLPLAQFHVCGVLILL